MRQLETGEGGEQPLSFYLAPAVGAARMIENMRVNIARGLPEVQLCRPHSLKMSIAGGGPSLADTYQEMDGWICAINGSLQFLIDNNFIEGRSVACAICDAGEHIPDVVAAHPDVRYYIASVCDPRLIDKLLDAGCEVILWHVTPQSTEDAEGVTRLLSLEYDSWFAVGGGCTMGLRWVNLGYMLGFRDFGMHGMDSSFRKGSTHAYPDRADHKEHMEFKGHITRPNFIAQVFDFAEMLEWLHDHDPDVHLEVYGDGLLQEEWRSFREANPRAFKGPKHDQRAEAVLRRVPEGAVAGAEVGVFTGRMSRALLKRNSNLTLVMIDSWEGDGAAYIDPTGDWHAELSQERQDHSFQWALRNVDFARDRCVIIKNRSIPASEEMADEQYDFVFLDADHSYEGVKADIDAWWPKIKQGGWLCGHDYGSEFSGVKQAVDELGTPELDVDTTWFIRKSSASEQAINTPRSMSTV